MLALQEMAQAMTFTIKHVHNYYHFSFSINKHQCGIICFLKPESMDSSVADYHVTTC